MYGPERRILSAQEKQANILLVDNSREELDALRWERIANKLPDFSIKETMVIVAAKHPLFEPADFRAGECLCQAGDDATDAFLIVDGVVQVQLHDGIVVASLQRDEVAGEYGMFVGGKRTATMVAQGGCQTLLPDYQRFSRFLLTCPEACVSLLKSTIQRLVSSNQAKTMGPAGAEVSGGNSGLR